METQLYWHLHTEMRVGLVFFYDSKAMKQISEFTKVCFSSFNKLWSNTIIRKT